MNTNNLETNTQTIERLTKERDKLREQKKALVTTLEFLRDEIDFDDPDDLYRAMDAANKALARAKETIA